MYCYLFARCVSSILCFLLLELLPGPLHPSRVFILSISLWCVFGTHCTLLWESCFAIILTTLFWTLYAIKPLLNFFPLKNSIFLSHSLHGFLFLSPVLVRLPLFVALELQSLPSKHSHLQSSPVLTLGGVHSTLCVGLVAALSSQGLCFLARLFLASIHGRLTAGEWAEVAGVTSRAYTLADFRSCAAL